MNKKVYEAVMDGNSDNNIRFSDLQNLLLALGFELKRQRGSHILYYHYETGSFMNIQKDGAKAKGYEVRQLREIIIKHGL